MLRIRALAPLRIVALLAAVGSVPVGAQEPDTIPDPSDPRQWPERPERQERPDQPQDTASRQPSTRSPAALSYIPPRFAFSVTASTFGFDELQSQPVVLKRQDAAGMVLDSAFMTRSVEAEGGFQIGASGLMSLGAGWAVRAGAALGWTTLRPRYRGEETLFETAGRRIAASEEADATVVTGEAALRMRLPSSRRAQPYLEIGASAIEWRIESSPGFPGAGANIRRFGGLAGIGLEIPFSERLSARAQATQRVFRTPLDAVPAGTEGSVRATTAVEFAASPADLFADAARELSTGLRLELGVSLGVGRAVKAPTDRAEPAASPSPPVR